MPNKSISHIQIVDNHGSTIFKGGNTNLTIYKTDTDYSFVTALRYDFGVQEWRLSKIVDWQHWEYVNPPMELNKEYRTTERWEGKPVYRQLFPYWSIPSNSGRQTDTDLPFSSTYIVACKLRTSVGGDFIVSNSNIKSVAVIKNQETGFWAMYMETDRNYSSDSDIYWDISYCYL